MKTVVTGGAGFIGSHLCEALLKEGHHVMVIDDLSTGSLENVRHLLGNRRFHFARASVTDAVVMDRLASTADTIFHLAAAVGVKLIIERPVHTIRTNIMGTEAVLEAALRYGCRVLIASTSEVYGKGSKAPFAEEDDVVLGPTSHKRWSYACSKMVDEFLGLAYCSKYDLKVVIVRLFNTVGPRQSGQYGMVVPTFVKQALSGDPITVYGDGRQTRCFCDVSDVVRALTGLAWHEGAFGAVLNVGSDEEVSIQELAERVKNITGSSSPIVQIPYADAYGVQFEDMRRRLPDTGRVRNLIGWEPSVDLNDILRQIADHFQSESAI